VARPEFGPISAAIERAQRPISHSETAFELPERDLIPEGTAWDSATRTLFLSRFYRRKIVAVARDGTARDFIFSGQDGIGPVAGMEADDAYEMDTGQLHRRYLLAPAGGVGHGFNDLTVMPDGDVYTTDTRSGAVYRLPAGADSLIAVVPPGTYVFPNGST